MWCGSPGPLSRTETTGPPTFPGDPCACMLRSPTPVGPGNAGRNAHPTAFRRAFRASDDVGSHDDQDDGAQSRSLQARCLRFAARVTPTPRKTRFRPVAGLPDGIGYPSGSPQQGFRSALLHRFLLVRASWRTRGSCLSESSSRGNHRLDGRRETVIPGCCATAGICINRRDRLQG